MVCGGGYTICNELPYTDYFAYFGLDFKLHISPSNMTNQNTTEYLDKIKNQLFENLRMLPHAPGVQMQAIPEDAMQVDREEVEKPDVRQSQGDKDKRVSVNNEFSDSEDEGDRKDQKSHKGKKLRLEKPEPKVKTEDKPAEETKDNG